MQAAILCGGLGTRLGALTRETPKPMVQVAGRPFLEYEVDLLRRNGVDDIVLCIGYRGEQIRDYFRDGSSFGVRISYSYDGRDLVGPAGALRKASHLLDEIFFVTYGDAYLRAEYTRAMNQLRRSSALGLMTVYRNEDRHGRSDLVVNGGRVVVYDKKATRPGMRWINYGVSVLRKEALELVPRTGFCGEEEFYGELIRRGELLALSVRRRFYEIGTRPALEEFSSFAEREGLVPGPRRTS